MTKLDVYIESVDEPIGELSSDPEGSVSFRYVKDDLPHPISISMPVQEEPYGDVAARGFFTNLLFENEMREQVMQRHDIVERDIVGLLYHLGRDCPGAISCVPQGDGPGKRPGNLVSDYEPIDDAAVDMSCDIPFDTNLAAIMSSLRDNRRMPGNTNDPSPLAGVQGKLALTLLPDGRFALPRSGSGAPTTHILKVPRRAEMTHVLREHIAMNAMSVIQPHPVATTIPIGGGDTQGLLIERFDRRIVDGNVYRIHQEDFCQALGLGHLLKYERYGSNEKKFSAAGIGSLIERSVRPGEMRQAMLGLTVANMILGNSDNHGKNHALLYKDSKPELAPIYDVDPVLLDDVNHEMGFHIGKAKIAEDVTIDDINKFCLDIGYKRLSKKHIKYISLIAEKAVHYAKNMEGPITKRLRDVIFQHGYHLSNNLDLRIDIPEYDAVFVNR